MPETEPFDLADADGAQIETRLAEIERQLAAVPALQDQQRRLRALLHADDTVSIDVAAWARECHQRVLDAQDALTNARAARRQAFTVARAVESYGVEGLVRDLGMAGHDVQQIIDGAD